jgi:hypothetical protein
MGIPCGLKYFTSGADRMMRHLRGLGIGTSGIFMSKRPNFYA